MNCVLYTVIRHRGCTTDDVEAYRILRQNVESIFVDIFVDIKCRETDADDFGQPVKALRLCSIQSV